MEDKGRHFVLQLLKFIFEVTRRCPLPRELQQKLEIYNPDRNSFFSGVVAKALVISITDYMENDGNLPRITSQEFKKELKTIDKNEVFLKFVGRYSVKVFSEYSNNHLKCPLIFLKSITKFMANIEINEGSVSHYLEQMNESAERIINEDRKRIQAEPLISTCVTDMAKEKSFLANALNFLFILFNVPEKVRLKNEDPQNLLTLSVENALTKIVHHHKRFLWIGGYEFLKNYFYNRCIKSFDVKDFFELCVCYVGTITCDNSEEMSLETAENTCDSLLEVLERAKRENKFTLAGLHEAAHDLNTIFKKLYPNF